MKACPRYVARNQFNHLNSMGYSLFSATEAEVSLEDGESHKPLFSHKASLSSEILGDLEDWFVKMDEVLVTAGIPVHRMHVECSPGQLEISTDPEFNLPAIDHFIILKQLMKEVSTSMGYKATFLTKDLSGLPINQAHFNFSLWDKDGKCNLFIDEQSPDGLSDIAHYWIAGLVADGPALKALCCPTTNCYNHNGCPWIPLYSNWGIDNRLAMIRVKKVSDIYMESRLPTALANPYIVAAATIAAGTDGLMKKMKCPEPEDETGEMLPQSLEDALQALKADQVMVEALGGEFVEWFVCVKQSDVDAIKGVDDDTSRLNIETSRYGSIY